MRAGPLLRWIGSFSTRRALLGAVGTLIAGREPGFLLGFAIIVGTIITALGIKRPASYVIIPLPALTYLVLATLTGAVHDSGIDTSKEAIGLSFLQWIGGGFFAISVATIAVLLIFGARLIASRQFVSGQFAMSARRPPAGRFPRAPMTTGSRLDQSQRPRESRAPWEKAEPWDPLAPRDKRDPWKDRDPRDRGPRDNRDSKTGRDERRDERDSRGEPGRRDPRAPRDRREGREGRDPRDGRDPWYERPRSAGSNVPPDRDPSSTRKLPPDRDAPSTRKLPPTREAPRPRPRPRPGMSDPRDDPWGGRP
ncbi:MAG TPA: hypothetical protein VG164_03420 [Trebonia sp.]|nr:hypothetical protein [Trebonia sp.]